MDTSKHFTAERVRTLSKPCTSRGKIIDLITAAAKKDCTSVTIEGLKISDEDLEFLSLGGFSINGSTISWAE